MDDVGGLVGVRIRDQRATDGELRSTTDGGERMRLHVTSFPFAHVRADVSVCAYTQKIRKLVKMLAARGWDITLYGGSESEVPDSVDLAVVYTEKDQMEWYGNVDKQLL